MPRIPLYAKGAGPTVELATGQLGARPSVAAFTAPGEAMARAGEAIGRAGATLAEGQMRIDEGQIKAEKTRQTNEIEFQRRQKKVEFDFAIAERDAEDRRIIAEEADRAVIATSEFLEQNRDTDTRTFNENFGTHRDGLIKDIDGRGYTPRRKALVENAIRQSTRAQRTSGANQAFGRGQLARTNASEATIATAVNQLGLYAEGHPERFVLLKRIEDTFVDADNNGLRLKFTRGGVQQQVLYQDYNRQIEGAGSHREIAAILSKLKVDGNVSQANREKLIVDLNNAESRLFNDAREGAAGVLNEAVFSAREQSEVETAIEQGGVYTFSLPDGSQSTVDFSQVRSTDVGGILSIANRRFKDVEDLTSDNILFAAVNEYDVKQSGVENAARFGLNYSDEAIAIHGKTPEQLDDIALNLANQHQDYVTNTIKSEGVTRENYPTLVARLEASEALLSAQLGGRPPLSVRTGADQTAVIGIKSGIASAREDLRKAVKEKAALESNVAAMKDGGFEFIAGQVTEKETKAAVNAVMASLAGNVPAQIENLSKNGTTYETFKKTLNAQAERLIDKNFDPESAEMEQINLGVELYRQMKLSGRGVTGRHVSPENKKIYEGYLRLEAALGQVGAIRALQRQRDDIDVNASYKQVQSAVESISDEASQSYSWYQYIPGLGPDEDFVVQNTSEIQSYVSKVTKDYIRLGVDAEAAVELAAKDYAESHVRVRNMMMPKMAGMPSNIEDMATAAVNDVMLRFPSIAENYDSEELSIAPLQGTMDRWTLVHSGGSPVIVTDPDNPQKAYPVEFNLKELDQYMVTQRSDAGLIKTAKVAELNFRKAVESEFVTRTGRFEGLTKYEAQNLRLRLLYPWRSYRLEGEDVRKFSEKMEKIIAETPGAGGA